MQFSGRFELRWTFRCMSRNEISEEKQRLFTICWWRWTHVCRLKWNTLGHYLMISEKKVFISFIPFYCWLVIHWRNFQIVVFTFRFSLFSLRHSIQLTSRCVQRPSKFEMIFSRISCMPCCSGFGTWCMHSNVEKWNEILSMTTHSAFSFSFFRSFVRALATTWNMNAFDIIICENMRRL